MRGVVELEGQQRGKKRGEKKRCVRWTKWRKRRGKKKELSPPANRKEEGGSNRSRAFSPLCLDTQFAPPPQFGDARGDSFLSLPNAIRCGNEPPREKQRALTHLVARRPVGRVVDAPALDADARVAAAGLLGLFDDDRDGGVCVGDCGAGLGEDDDGLFDDRRVVLAGGGVCVFCFFYLIEGTSS